MEEKELLCEKGEIELAYKNGKWHPTVETELNKLRSKGLFTVHGLSDGAREELMVLAAEIAVLVLQNIDKKADEEDITAWIFKECSELRTLWSNKKEKWEYKTAKLLMWTRKKYNAMKTSIDCRNMCFRKWKEQWQAASTLGVLAAAVGKMSESKKKASERVVKRPSKPVYAARKGIPPPSEGEAFQNKKAPYIVEFHYKRINGKLVKCFDKKSPP
jgi:hypothetical protein